MKLPLVRPFVENVLGTASHIFFAAPGMPFSSETNTLSVADLLLWPGGQCPSKPPHVRSDPREGLKYLFSLAYIVAHTVQITCFPERGTGNS